ncbi:MAG: hypothetical protein QNJ94_24165, partial [Alphaproteobacteria bacterium]|nr:hypothetical protein [Alphaproteobacteria bacterium]
ADLGARIDLAQVSALSRTLFRRQLTDIVQEILADRDTPCSRARQNQLVAELLEDIVGQARWSRASTTRTWSRCATETPSPISWSTAP